MQRRGRRHGRRRAWLGAGVAGLLLVTSTAATAASPPRPALNWELISVTAGDAFVQDLMVTSTLHVQPDRPGPFIVGIGFAYPAANFRHVDALNYGGGPRELTVQAGSSRMSQTLGSVPPQGGIGDNINTLNLLAPRATVYVLNFWANAHLSVTGQGRVSARSGAFTVRRVVGGGVRSVGFLDATDTGSGVVADGAVGGMSIHQFTAPTGLVGAFADTDASGYAGTHSTRWQAPNGQGDVYVQGGTDLVSAGKDVRQPGFAGPGGDWLLEEASVERHAATPAVAAWAPIGSSWFVFAPPTVPTA